MINNPLDSYFNSEEFKSNLALYEKSKEEGRDCILSSDELADIAEYYFECGDYPKARAAAEYAVSLYPDAQAPLTFLARYSLVVRKDKDKAKEYLKRMVVSDMIDYYCIVAEYYLFEGKNEKAFDSLQKGELLIEDDEEHEDYIYDAVCLLLDYSQIDEAKTWLERFKDKETDDVLRLNARLLFESGDYDGGAKIMETLIDRKPFDAELWSNFASAQLNFEKYSDALTSCDYALAVNDKFPMAYFNQGAAYFKLGNYQKAIAAYNRFAEDSNSEQADLMKARCYFCLQQTDKSLELLAEAEKKCSENRASLYDIYKDYAIVYGWSAQYDKAFFYLEKLKEENFVDAELDLIEAGIYLGMAKFTEANDAFAKGYDKAKSKPNYLFQVAVTYYEHGCDLAAYLVMKELFDEEPDRVRGLAYMAACCNYLGRREEFLDYLKLCVDRNPEEAVAVLADFFPKGMLPSEYLEYALLSGDNLNNRNK